MWGISVYGCVHNTVPPTSRGQFKAQLLFAPALTSQLNVPPWPWLISLCWGITLISTIPSMQQTLPWPWWPLGSIPPSRSMCIDNIDPMIHTSRSSPQKSGHSFSMKKITHSGCPPQYQPSWEEIRWINSAALQHGVGISESLGGEFTASSISSFFGLEMASGSLDPMRHWFSWQMQWSLGYMSLCYEWVHCTNWLEIGFRRGFRQWLQLCVLCQPTSCGSDITHQFSMD